MDPVILEAFATRLAQGPLYVVWVFDPQSGEVEIVDPEQDPTGIPSHDEIAQKYPHPDRQHGYAYRIKDGWRITDWEHKAVEDRFIVNAIQRAVRGQDTVNQRSLARVAYEGREVANHKWAWIEGLPVEEWADSEIGGDEEGLYRNMREDGLDTQGIEKAFEDGSAENYEPLQAHFETLAKMAQSLPQLQGDPKLMELADQGFGGAVRDYNRNTMNALDEHGIKWAVGIDTYSEEGSPEKEIGAMGKTTTPEDVKAALGGTIYVPDSNPYTGEAMQWEGWH